MVLVEIEKLYPAVPASTFRKNVYHFPVYEAGPNEFDWMGGGTPGRSMAKAAGLVVDGSEYRRKDTDDPMSLAPGQFCQKGNAVYVKTKKGRALYVYYNPKHSAVIGFTDEKPCEMDGIAYNSGIDYAARPGDEADSLEYGRMKFASENISLINTSGVYDSADRYFGSGISIKTVEGGEAVGLYKYYIKNVKIREDRTTFVCGDRRENLRQKVPALRFSAAEYPHIKPELEGGLKQDVYGECEWVNCTCVDELKIFKGSDKASGLKEYRTFYAARKITELKLVDTSPYADGIPNKTLIHNSVWVKQTQPDSIDSGDPGAGATHSGETWTPCYVRSIDAERGEFTLDIKYCMPPTFTYVNEDGEEEEGWGGYDVPDVYEVRACGVFWAPGLKTEARPLDIIKELLGHYCGIPYDEYMYSMEEIEAELGGLAPVGIVYDSETEVFKAIEKLQNASDYGFRFTTKYDKFTARIDDNGRKPAAAIKITDIVDIGKAEIDMRAEYYATIVSIAYHRNYLNGTALHYEGRACREEMLNAHGIEKVYEPETYLTNEGDAKKKARLLEAFFKKSRVKINGLEVLNHPRLRVYDIVEVDLRIPLERRGELKQAAVLFGGPERENVVFGGWPGERIAAGFEGADEEPAYREFGGVIMCKVMSVSLDLDTMVNTLSLLEAGE